MENKLHCYNLKYTYPSPLLCAVNFLSLRFLRYTAMSSLLSDNHLPPFHSFLFGFVTIISSLSFSGHKIARQSAILSFTSFTCSILPIEKFLSTLSGKHNFPSNTVSCAYLESSPFLLLLKEERKTASPFVYSQFTSWTI